MTKTKSPQKRAKVRPQDLKVHEYTWTCARRRDLWSSISLYFDAANYGVIFHPNDVRKLYKWLGQSIAYLEQEKDRNE